VTNKIESFWNDFLAVSIRAPVPEFYEAWSFGNTPDMKDSLADLVLNGRKRATTSLVWGYEKSPGEKLPTVGGHSIILNSAGEPICIIETMKVEKRKFSQIDDEYAFIEGEGDRSLKYWREGHWRFFSKECELLERVPSEDMPVICEIFRMVYPKLDVLV
jgi:uncharacterized protein YhfF